MFNSQGNQGPSLGLSVGATNLAATRDGQTAVIRPAELTVQGQRLTGFVDRVGDPVPLIAPDGSKHRSEELLADAMRSDSGLQVVASASTSEELLAAVVRVPVDVAIISYNLDDHPGQGTQVLREIRALRAQIKGILLLDTSRPETVLECFRAGAKGIFSKHERLENLCKAIRCVHEGAGRPQTSFPGIFLRNQCRCPGL